MAKDRAAAQDAVRRASARRAKSAKEPDWKLLLIVAVVPLVAVLACYVWPSSALPAAAAAKEGAPSSKVYPRGRSELEAAVAADPNDAQSHRQLAMLALREGRHEDAGESLRAALSVPGLDQVFSAEGEANLHYNLGVLAMQGAATQLQGSDTLAVEDRASRLGRIAVDQWAIALATHPTHPQAEKMLRSSGVTEELLAEIRAAGGQIAKANARYGPLGLDEPPPTIVEGSVEASDGLDDGDVKVAALTSEATDRLETEQEKARRLAALKAWEEGKVAPQDGDPP